MTFELSNDLRSAIDAAGTPLKVVDPQSGRNYVLVSEDAFARIQSLIGDELVESYPAQIESAMRAGWDDPLMDEYNDYDRRRAT